MKIKNNESERIMKIENNENDRIMKFALIMSRGIMTKRRMMKFSKNA